MESTYFHRVLVNLKNLKNRTHYGYVYMGAFRFSQAYCTKNFLEFLNLYPVEHCDNEKISYYALSVLSDDKLIFLPMND